MNPPIENEDNDPIQLNFIEDTPPLDNLQFLDTGIIDINTDEDCAITALSSEKHLHQAAPSKQSFQEVGIKLVDCFKFSWYFNRSARNIIDKTFANRDIDKNRCIMTESNEAEYENKIVRLGTDAGSITETQHHTKEKAIDARKDNPKINKRLKRNDLELKNAITQRNKTEIDLKRNKGLVGMKIQKSQGTEVIEKSNTQAEINKLSYYVIHDSFSDLFTPALLNVGTSITPVFEDAIEINKKGKPSESIPCNIEKNTCITDTTCSLRPPNVEKTSKGHKITKDKRKDDEIRFTELYNNTMKVSQEIVKEVIGIGNQNDFTVENQRLYYDKANLGKEKSLGKKKTTEAKQTKKDKRGELNTSNQQKSADCFRTTKMLTAIPLTSKQRKKKNLKYKEKCEFIASELSKPVTNTSSVLTNNIYLPITHKSKPQPLEYHNLLKKLPLNEQNSANKNTASVILPTPNNETAPPLNAVKNINQHSQQKATEQPPIKSASKEKKKKSIILASDESISRIENNMKKKAHSKPTQAVALDTHAKSPPQVRKETLPIQTILTDRKNPNSQKETRKPSPQPVQAQVPSKPLTVHNSMQSHILYSPQTSPPPPQPLMSSDAPTLRYQVPMHQFNQPRFMYQPHYGQPGFMQKSLIDPPLSVYKQGDPQMFQYRHMTLGVYDVRPNKMFWPYTYPPPPPPPPLPPLPLQLPPTLPKETDHALPVSAVTQSNSSIIGKNNDGVVKKIAINTLPSLKDADKKHDIVKVEDIADPISISLYDKVSSVAKSTVPVSIKSEMRKPLDPNSLRPVNTSEQIDTINNNLKRPYPPDSSSSNDNSKTKLLPSKNGNPDQSTISPKTPNRAESKESSVVYSKSVMSMQGESTAANILKKAIRRVSLTRPNENLTCGPKESISESTKCHHTNSVKTVKRCKEPSKVKLNNQPIKRKHTDLIGDLFEIPLPNNIPDSNTNTPLPVRYKPGPLSKKSKLIDTRVSLDENKAVLFNEKSSKKYSLPILPIPTYENILSEIATRTHRHFNKKHVFDGEFKDPLDARRMQRGESNIDNSNRSSKTQLQYESEQNKKCEGAKKIITLNEYKKRKVGDRKTDDTASILKQNNINFQKKIDEMPRRISSVDSDLGYDSDYTVKL